MGQLQVPALQELGILVDEIIRHFDPNGRVSGGEEVPRESKRIGGEEEGKDGSEQ